MRKTTLLSTSLAATLVALLPAAPAQAANDVSFVRSNGVNTAGACTRAAPCATISFAMNETNEGGEIRCLDSGPFAPFGNSGKTITINCEGGTLNAPSIAVGVSVDLGTNKVVTVRNMTINGLGTGGFGIFVVGTGKLVVENVKITGIRGSDGFGIGVRPAAGQTSKVFVSDSLISDSGLAAGGGGIIVQNTGSGTAQVVLNRVQVVNNTHGIRADGNGGTGALFIEVRDSVTAYNAGNGISGVTAPGASPIGIIVDRTMSVSNAGFGIFAFGSPTQVHVGSSTINLNGGGLGTGSGGQIFSYQNNQVSVNSSDGAPTGVLTLK